MRFVAVDVRSSDRWPGEFLVNLASKGFQRRGLFARTLVVLCWVLGFQSGVTHVTAEGLPDGVNHVVSLPSARGITGFKTSVGFSEFTSTGYQPVEIKFNLPVASTADLRLTYRITSMTNYQSPADNGLVVDVPILVPEGTKSAVWIRYLPKWMTGTGFRVSVLQDDRRLKGYSGLAGPRSPLSSSFDWQTLMLEELTKNWLLVGPDLVVSQEDRQAVSKFNSTNRAGKSYRTIDVTIAGDGVLQGGPTWIKSNLVSPKALLCGQKNLPDDWRGYQRWDVVVMGTQAIDRLKQRDAEWKALREWLVVGGTIVVWDAQSQAELSSLFGDSADDARPTIKTLVAMGFNKQDLQTLGVSNSASSQSASTSLAGSKTLYAIRLGAGKALAVEGFGEDENGLGQTAKWMFLRDLLKQYRSSSLRRGGDPILGNRSFWRWLIPGVAQPPVYMLISFLTVFLVLVGPVAYRRMAKQGRSHLMFLIAPALATLTTVIMFGYGFVADGFSNVARIRQLTWVDGASGDAGEQVRGTYFAPIRPRGGLTFSGDAEVFGIRRPDGRSWNARHRSEERDPVPLGTVTITEDSQRFSSSFLPSREQRQFITHQPRAGIGRLRLKQSTGVNPVGKAINEFDFQLKDAVLRDREGVYWHVNNLEPGGIVEAELISPTIASVMLGKYYLNHRPMALGGTMDRPTNSFGRGFYSRYDIVTDNQTRLNTQLSVDMYGTTGQYEFWLQQQLQGLGELPNGHFVAISEVDEEGIALKGSVVQDSVRYVFGTLP